VGRDEYLAWLSLTKDDMDVMEESIREKFRLTGAEMSFSNSRKYKILKKRFQEFNSENNGILSRTDIYKLGKAAGYVLTEPEVSAVAGGRGGRGRQAVIG